MADISKIKLPNNTEYNIKDSAARSGSGRDNTKMPLAGGTFTGVVYTKGTDIWFGTSGSSSNDSGDLVWAYGNGNEKMRIYSGDYTTKTAPYFREYTADGTSLYNGYLVLGDGTGASGTWGINISGNAATATSSTTAGTASNLANFENNNSTGKNANDVTYNAHTYYTSNGPSTSIGASTNDGALYTQAYSTVWVGQIAQDYRNGNLFTRGKNNGTWQAWRKVAYTGDAPTAHNQSADTITSGYLNIQPENSPILIPFMNNDLAYMITRGGSTIVKYNGTTQSVDISGCFDAGPGYGYAISNSGDYTSIVMELTLHQTFAWTNTIYVDFGSSGWRAKDVEIEVMNSNYSGDTWTSKYHNTSNTLGHCYVITSHTPSGASNAGGGFNKIRFTFKSFNSAMFRIAQLGVYNYGSTGLRTTYMSRGIDDAVWRNISPATTNKYNLGSSSLKWKDVYATTFHGALDGNADTATSASKLGTTTVGSARQPIYLSNGSPTTANPTVYHWGNAGKSNMNDVGRHHASTGMTNLTDPSNTTDNPMNGETKATGWHLYWSTNYADDPNGSNAWVAQICNRAGSNNWWVRSRNGGTITDGTAWAASWEHLTISPQAGQGSSTNPIYVDKNGHTQSCTYSLNKTVPSNAVFTDTTYSAGDNMTLSSTTFYATKRWNAITQGQKWSRILLVENTNATVGNSGLLHVCCTRGNVVCNATFIINTSHSSYGQINQIGSNNYSKFKIRLLVNSSGYIIVDIYDTANSIASSTTQTWRCSYLSFQPATVTTYTAFTDDSTIPSGYTSNGEMETVVGNDTSAIRSITRSGTTFTATRQNGTTFTFTQQDSNDQFTLGISGNSVVLSKNGTAQNTITVPYATSAGSATTSARLSNDGRQTSADVNIVQGYNSVMRLMFSSSSMTTSNPGQDGYILTAGWDWSTWGMQLFLGQTQDPLIKIRGSVPINNNTETSWGDWYPIGRFSQTTPTSGQVIITDGTGGKIKASGYTIAKSVPSNAVFTDTDHTYELTSSNSSLVIATATSGNNTIWDVGVAKVNGHTVEKDVPSNAVFTDHTYNFGGTTFYSGNSGNAEHNADNMLYNGHYYYTSNGPATSLGASTGDGAIYAQAYSTAWVGQIAQDYRDGSLFVRGKNNGTWQKWLAVLDSGNIGYNMTSTVNYDPHTRKFITSKSTSAWDAQAYSTDGYVDNIILSFKPNQTNMAMMVGFDSNPSEDANYNKIDYALYCQNDGKVSIYESGAGKGVGSPTYAAGDEFRIEYSGGYVRYYHNGTLLREIARAVSGKLYMDSSFHGATSCIYDVSFGVATRNATYATSAGSATTASVASKSTITETNPSSATTYCVPFAANAGNQSLLGNDGLRYYTKQGTTSAVGWGELVLGNNTSTGTAGNKSGWVKLFSEKNGQAELTYTAAATGNTTHYLPTTGGTLLNTGTTSFTQTLTSGTKIGSIKINGTSTDIFAPNPALSAWPVGSIYISYYTSKTTKSQGNPATLFGGTWVEINSYILQALGPTSSPTSDGGLETYHSTSSGTTVQAMRVSIYRRTA